VSGEVATFGVSAFRAKRSDHSLVEQLPSGIVVDYLGRSVSVFEDRVEFDVYKTGFTKYFGFLFGALGFIIEPMLASLSAAPLTITVRWENARQVTLNEKRRSLSVWGVWDHDRQLWSCTAYLGNDDFDRLVGTLRATPAAAHALASVPPVS
jgi:hypothetical protein